MDQNNIYQRLGLSRVINAAGKLTVLGGSVLAPEVSRAMQEAGDNFVDVPELMRLAGERIAEACGAEAGFITSCAAAGVVLATAACLTRGDLSRVEALPRLPGPPDRMIIQRGHSIHFGASILQMMAMAGARVVEIGLANRVLPHHLAAALDEDTAGVLFVVSHHTVQSGLLPLESVIEMAHAREIPVVVDAAAELDLRKYIAAGADLVIYSSQKGIEGPASGFVAGRGKWIAACAQQNAGIGRPMKIGKESLVGALVALERFLVTDSQAALAEQEQAAHQMDNRLQGIPGLAAEVIFDPLRPIPRVRLRIDPQQAAQDARQLVQCLETQDPQIRTRNHDLEHGEIEVDFRNLRPGEAEEIIEALRRYLLP